MKTLIAFLVPFWAAGIAYAKCEPLLEVDHDVLNLPLEAFRGEVYLPVAFEQIPHGRLVVTRYTANENFDQERRIDPEGRVFTIQKLLNPFWGKVSLESCGHHVCAIMDTPTFLKFMDIYTEKVPGTMPEARPAVGFYPTRGQVDHETFVRRFVYERKLGIGIDGHFFYHDGTFHRGAVIVLDSIIDHAIKQARVIVEFKDFLQRFHPEVLRDREVESHFKGVFEILAVKIDTGNGNYSAYLLEHNYRMLQVATRNFLTSGISPWDIFRNYVLSTAANRSKTSPIWNKIHMAGMVFSELQKKNNPHYNDTLEWAKSPESAANFLMDHAFDKVRAMAASLMLMDLEAQPLH